MKPPKQNTDSPIQAAWWSCPELVYFFGAGNPTVAIKIGVAALTKGCGLKEGVTRRLKEIQTSNHEVVELLGIIRFTEGLNPTRDAEVLERELHTRFAHLKRFKPNTRGAEWFSASGDLVEYIKEHATAPEALLLPRVLASPFNRSEENRLIPSS